MSKETDEIMDQLSIPNPPTLKANPDHRYTDAKREAKMLFKSLKAGIITEDDLTEHGIFIVKKYYPFLR